MFAFLGVKSKTKTENKRARARVSENEIAISRTQHIGKLLFDPKSSMSLSDCGKYLIKFAVAFFFYSTNWLWFYGKNRCCRYIKSYCEVNKSSAGFRFQFIMKMPKKKRKQKIKEIKIKPVRLFVSPFFSLLIRWYPWNFTPWMHSCLIVFPVWKILHEFFRKLFPLGRRAMSIVKKENGIFKTT